MKTAYTHYEKTILEGIDLEPYGIDNDGYIYDKVKTVYNIFKDEYLKHHHKRNKDEKQLFADWLQGLPRVMNVPFDNHDILEQAETYGGFEFLNENLEDAYLLQYWYNLSQAFFTLKDNL